MGRAATFARMEFESIAAKSVLRFTSLRPRPPPPPPPREPPPPPPPREPPLLPPREALLPPRDALLPPRFALLPLRLAVLLCPRWLLARASAPPRLTPSNELGRFAVEDGARFCAL